MENQLLSPSKQAKPTSSTKMIFSQPHLPKKIPKNIFLRITTNIAIDKALRKSQSTPSGLKGKVFWKYTLAFKRLHNWKFFKNFDTGINRRISSCWFSFISFMTLTPKTIRPFPFVKKLTISFDHEITNKSLEPLMEQVCHTLQLEELTLNISKCERISVDAMKSITLQIAKHQFNLKMLVIHTQTYPRIDDKGLEILGDQIGRHLIHLRFLELRFNEKSLGIDFKPKPKLEQSTALGDKTLISDKGLKSLANNIGKRLTSLQHLTIEFSWVREISDKGVRALVTSIGKELRHLKSLELTFQKCTSLSGSGVKLIVTVLCKYFKRLEMLSLNFDQCGNWFSDDWEAVRNKIYKELNQLQKVTLNGREIKPRSA